ncbi:hypothetical protein CSKR_102023 [Clonorchis sinensis]|uniref:Uncharacterized protein n=1 Tax=Clonorchis sinensis TaxID=79923 RepID=A0A3R7CAM7_CLOSI|nr:hypothetical protein CSKR_102023 [Clonorchis sinensis]
MLDRLEKRLAVKMKCNLELGWLAQQSGREQHDARMQGKLVVMKVWLDGISVELSTHPSCPNVVGTELSGSLLGMCPPLRVSRPKNGPRGQNVQLCRRLQKRSSSVGTHAAVHFRSIRRNVTRKSETTTKPYFIPCQAFSVDIYKTSVRQLQPEAAWCSTFGCLETSQTRGSTGFQLSLSENRIYALVFLCGMLSEPQLSNRTGQLPPTRSSDGS